MTKTDYGFVEIPKLVRHVAVGIVPDGEDQAGNIVLVHDGRTIFFTREEADIIYWTLAAVLDRLDGKIS